MDRLNRFSGLFGDQPRFNTVAYFDDRQPVLLTRTEWSDPTGEEVVDYARRLSYESRFELFEAMSADLLRRNPPRHAMTGQEINGRMDNQAAVVAIHVSTHPDKTLCREVAQPMTKWLSSGSEPANFGFVDIETALVPGLLDDRWWRAESIEHRRAVEAGPAKRISS